MAIRPFSLFSGFTGLYSRAAAKTPPASERLEALRAERAQLEENAGRLGLSGDSDSPLAASHRSILAKIDAEMQTLEARAQPPARQAREPAPAAEAPKAAGGAKKPAYRPAPNRAGVYPPGTFLDIYA